MPEHQKPALRNPTNYFNGLERTDEYLGAIAKTGDRAKSLGHAASVFSERMGKDESPSIEKQQDMYAVQLLAQLPKFLEGNLAIDKDKSHTHLSKAEVDRHMTDIILFNHTLRDMIDMFPGLKVIDITRFIKTAALDMYGRNEAVYAEQSTRQALVGMQNEVGLEQILWQIEGVDDVIKATVSQERHGIDMTVAYRDQKLTLDAKASSKGVDEAYGKWLNNFSRGREGGYPIWTRINYEDFEGGFRISDERAKKLAPYIQAELDRLYEEQSVAV